MPPIKECIDQIVLDRIFNGGHKVVLVEKREWMWEKLEKRNKYDQNSLHGNFIKLIKMN